MQAPDVDYVRKCIDDNNLHRFYTWAPWINLRAEVLRDDKGECQTCKRRGIYAKATHVHHLKHVRKHPELALVKIMPGGTRQLVSLCKACHELEHPERMRKGGCGEPITEERWD